MASVANNDAEIQPMCVWWGNLEAHFLLASIISSDPSQP
jgi:hypothetical protein